MLRSTILKNSVQLHLFICLLIVFKWLMFWILLRGHSWSIPNLWQQFGVCKLSLTHLVTHKALPRLAGFFKVYTVTLVTVCSKAEIQDKEDVDTVFSSVHWLISIHLAIAYQSDVPYPVIECLFCRSRFLAWCHAGRFAIHLRAKVRAEIWNLVILPAIARRLFVNEAV